MAHFFGPWPTFLCYRCDSCDSKVGLAQKSGPRGFWRPGLFLGIATKSRGGPFFVK
nr:MAG TPA: hypothetical protein [Caudoviricetes sp.]